jgi:peptidoglycan/xylan/chitin deacetylase (PgdA/CDA1 family)
VKTAARAVAGLSFAAGATAVAVHALPAVGAVGPLRRRLMPRLAGVGDRGHVALTFDDGPHAEATPRLLRLLDSAGVRATFFLVAHELAENPEVGRAIVAAGHEVGVHAYEHRLLLKRGPRATYADLFTAKAMITELTGSVPRWWRPPYGLATGAAVIAARRLHLTPVLWTCWGRDWSVNATPDRIFRSISRGLSGGGTILLHDSDASAAPRCWESMLDALPAILTLCRARGLEVGPLGEHGLW